MSAKYQITVNHPKYRDCPPMEAFDAKDLREAISEIVAYGVPQSRIIVQSLTDNRHEGTGF